MATLENIPIYTNLDDLCQNLGASLNHTGRWDNLAQEFLRRFGRKPDYIARAPGRINLIGEHIDYALFGVFPAAIEHDVLVACAGRQLSASCDGEHLGPPGNVVAENLDARYTRQVFAPIFKDRDTTSTPSHVEKDREGATTGRPGWHLEIDTRELRWESYIKAGYYGVLDHYFSPSPSNPTPAPPAPVDLLVTGTVPPGSGLSSSAALVVASTLAFLAVNGKLDDQQHKITKRELVRMAMENEKRVGVNSGGMDQAASVMSVAGSALFISFHPTLGAETIPLPSGSVFICTNSLVVSDKVVHAPVRYNLRVAETLIGARILAKKLGVQLDGAGGREKLTLREVVGRLVGEGPTGLSASALKEALQKAVKEAEALLPRGTAELGVTIAEMVALSGLEEKEFRELYLSRVGAEVTHFQVYRRVKHVILEALRVLQFREICLNASTSTITTGSEETLGDLGRLMNESHESCARLFECSCPELDDLTRLASEAGAYGSRLTGAGWGGYAVSLVAETEVGSFVTNIRKSYAPYREMDDETLRTVVFATKPSSGACVYKFE